MRKSKSALKSLEILKIYQKKYALLWYSAQNDEHVTVEWNNDYTHSVIAFDICKVCKYNIADKIDLSEAAVISKEIKKKKKTEEPIKNVK